jgi:uncharacterized damage-inducible protein DinB
MATDDDERTALLHFLQYQRDAVRGIVEGLSEENWHTSVVPSGWTPAGFVEHLAGAEWHWFEQVLDGAIYEPAPDEVLEPYDPHAAFTSSQTSTEVLQNYIDQCKRSDATLERFAMSDKPKAKHGNEDVESVRWIVLHMIEETATHSGHLEIARELLDGGVRLGQR